MFQAIRKAHPDIPIIIMTAVSKNEMQMQKELADIIYQTYTTAKDAGDRNVYFWNGKTEFAQYEEYGTVEIVHPNDHGFWGMAQSLIKMIDTII